MERMNLTKDDFEESVKTGVTLVDFYADWCGPCKMVAPVVEELSREVADAQIAKVNVDMEPEISQKYGIRSIPSFLVFKDGEVVESKVGALPKAELQKLIEKHL